jgi:argininosuccinate synthase
MQEQGLPEIKFDVEGLYREELFTDRRAGTLRRMTPVLVDGTVDANRPVLYAGQTQFLTPGGVLKVLNKLGGRHGIGRVDLVENRFVGMKSRGVYETPGGTILMQAHRQVESLTLDREVLHLRDGFIPKYAELVYNGFWFAPEREMLQAMVDESQRFVTGTVRLKLYKGNIITCGRKSKYSLYDDKIASMEGVKSWYNQSDATGFIRLNGLRLRARNLAQGGPKI